MRRCRCGDERGQAVPLAAALVAIAVVLVLGARDARRRRGRCRAGPVGRRRRGAGRRRPAGVPRRSPWPSRNGATIVTWRRDGDDVVVDGRGRCGDRARRAADAAGDCPGCGGGARVHSGVVSPSKRAGDTVDECRRRRAGQRGRERLRGRRSVRRRRTGLLGPGRAGARSCRRARRRLRNGARRRSAARRRARSPSGVRSPSRRGRAGSRPATTSRPRRAPPTAPAPEADAPARHARASRPDHVPPERSICAADGRRHRRRRVGPDGAPPGRARSRRRPCRCP